LGGESTPQPYGRLRRRPASSCIHTLLYLQVATKNKSDFVTIDGIRWFCTPFVLFASSCIHTILYSHPLVFTGGCPEQDGLRDHRRHPLPCTPFISVYTLLYSQTVCNTKSTRAHAEGTDLPLVFTPLSIHRWLPRTRPTS